LRLAPDPRRHPNDYELRYDYASRDDDGGPAVRVHRQNAAHEREHRRIGELEQRDAGREDEQLPIPE
jgi:hypothetical protein